MCLADQGCGSDHYFCQLLTAIGPKGSLVPRPESRNLFVFLYCLKPLVGQKGFPADSKLANGLDLCHYTEQSADFTGGHISTLCSLKA